MGKGGQVLEQFCASFDEHGNRASIPVTASTFPHTYPTTPPSPPRTPAAVTPMYGFGTATRPGSPAFWSPPRRPDSPMSIVSSSPESGSEIGVRIAKPLDSPSPTGSAGGAGVNDGRSRRGHQRHMGMGIGVGVGMGVNTATTACVS